MRRLNGDERLALFALGAIILVTAGWWALALWPVQAAPEWLSRTRAVCFGAAPGGLPDGGGWILLIGQPLSMLGFLLIVWGGLVRQSLKVVLGRSGGRLAIMSVSIALFGGFTSAGIRVASVVATPDYSDTGPDAATYPRLDRETPPLRLVDQTGGEFDLAALRGRPVLLTFAYAHCETICPVVVQQTLAARERAAGRAPTVVNGNPAGAQSKLVGADSEAVVVVVTLDPWRDTPTRLASISTQWGLREGDYVLSGDVPAVLSVLDSWNMPITRHENTGLIDHPAVVYVIAADGRIAFATTGGTDLIADLLRRS